MDNSVINFSSLEKEVEATLEADRKYRRENDAKFRALRQNVTSYDEFRDIVLASHLKPLERKEIAGAPRKQPWNPLVLGKKQENDINSQEEDKLQLFETQPRCASEFIRDWRRFTGSSSERYSFLVRLGGEALQELFITEIGLGLLGEFLQVLSQELQPGHEREVISVLDGFSRTGRFGLNQSLLSATEQKASEELFQKLQVATREYSSKDDSHHITLSHESSQSQTEDNKINICEKLKGLAEKYCIKSII